MVIKVLNLYAGIGGNRRLWDNVEVTAIENNEIIAKIYSHFFPKDKVIVTDAHQYLLDHFKEFDFIWSSPPCPTHSRMRLYPSQVVYPDMTLYQEIIFLKRFFKGKWVVENVISYYEPLIKPIQLSRHYFWSNFDIGIFDLKGCNIARATKESLSKYHDIPLWKGTQHRLLLRNCVNPQLGLFILKSAYCP